MEFILPIVFFHSSLPSRAPALDLLAVSQMRAYRSLQPKLADNCLQSLCRHSWYLTEELVVLSLVDKSLWEEERKAAAEALDATVREDSLAMGKPTLPDVTGDTFRSDI